jgi:hypothetical protein
MRKSVFYYLITGVFVLVTFIAALWNIITLFTDFRLVLFFAALLFFLLIPAIIYLVNKWKVPVWIQGAALFLFALAIRIVWIYNVPTVPISDFELLYNASTDWVRGDFSFVKTPYFDMWSYQLGYVWFQSLLMRLFGTGYEAIKIFNCIFSSLTVLTGYLTAKKLFGPNCALMTGILIASDITLVTMTSVLTNQHIALLLFYIGLYIIACTKNKIGYRIAAGAVIAFGNIMRPLGIVVLAAIVLYDLFFAERQEIGHKMLFHNGFWFRTKKFARTKLVLVVCFLAAYVIVGFAVNRSFIASGVTDKPLGNKDPLWKFVSGLNYEIKGQYSQKDIETVSRTGTFEERQNLEKEIIKQRLQETHKLPGLFKDKFYIMWVNKNYTVNWSVHPTEEGKDTFFGGQSKERLHKITLYADKAVYTVGLVFALAGALLLLITGNENEKGATLYMIFILLYIGAHLFIEIQPRYRMCVLPGIYVIASKGLHALGSFSKIDQTWRW